MQRPDATEHAPYYGKYIALVPETDVLGAMETQLRETLSFLRALPENAGTKRYAPGKWTVSEVVGHVIDTERVFFLRALWFARSAPGALPGMEQDDWNAVAGYAGASLADLSLEFELIRRSHILMFRRLGDDAWSRRGIASGVEFTVRALAFMMVGHERHHLSVLRTHYAL